MKIVWKTKVESGSKRTRIKPISGNPNLPFESPDEAEPLDHSGADFTASTPNLEQLAASFESQGILLAESGQFKQALAKLESAITVTPDKSKLHEQKAQILLELGDTWNALKSAARATQLEPSWVEAWITLGRAQLNFGEPDMAIESFDHALEIKPDHDEAKSERQTASRLIKRRKQLHSSGLPSSESRYKVGDKDGPSTPHKSLVLESNSEH